MPSSGIGEELTDHVGHVPQLPAGAVAHDEIFLHGKEHVKDGEVDLAVTEVDPEVVSHQKSVA